MGFLRSYALYLGCCPNFLGFLDCPWPCLTARHLQVYWPVAALTNLLVACWLDDADLVVGRLVAVGGWLVTVVLVCQ